jgi:hypothetical protein
MRGAAPDWSELAPIHRLSDVSCSCDPKVPVAIHCSDVESVCIAIAISVNEARSWIYELESGEIES